MLDKKLVIEIMQKAARCWAGYEPVPGAKAYSEGSCRPKGSKKTKKEVIQGKNHTEPKEKRGEYYTGKYSQRPFNADHARQTLGPSASNMSDEAAYMEMINKFENGSLDPIQFQAFNTQYGKYRPKFQAKPGSPQPPQVQAPQARPPVAKRPSPCGPGGCPVPRPVKPPVARTPMGVPRLVPGVPPKPVTPGSRPTMTQMPPRQ